MHTLDIKSRCLCFTDTFGNGVAKRQDMAAAIHSTPSGAPEAPHSHFSRLIGNFFTCGDTMFYDGSDVFLEIACYPKLGSKATSQVCL